MAGDGMTFVADADDDLDDERFDSSGGRIGDVLSDDDEEENEGENKDEEQEKEDDEEFDEDRDSAVRACLIQQSSVASSNTIKSCGCAGDVEAVEDKALRFDPTSESPSARLSTSSRTLITVAEVEEKTDDDSIGAAELEFEEEDEGDKNEDGDDEVEDEVKDDEDVENEFEDEIDDGAGLTLDLAKNSATDLGFCCRMLGIDSPDKLNKFRISSCDKQNQMRIENHSKLTIIKTYSFPIVNIWSHFHTRQLAGEKRSLRK